MNIQVIKKIVESYSIEQLKMAEENLLDEKPLGIEIEGKDEGEQLTNINQAIRLYSQRVRGSIS